MMQTEIREEAETLRAIVVSQNAELAKYEQLLLKRDAVRKTSLHYEWEYIRIFGDLLLKVFRKKIECIEKKKTIEYCRLFLNRGEEPDLFGLQDYLDLEMGSFREQLQNMADENRAVQEAKTLPELEIVKIKKIYKKIARLIHPDLNPRFADVPIFKDLWERVNTAYRCNQLKEMEELQVLVGRALRECGKIGLETEIPDLTVKIKMLEAEIEQIKAEDPYQYKYLLEDGSAVEEKKAELDADFADYEDYGRQLDEILEELLDQGGKKGC